jgi:apolipoprotein N-acyltransferase
MDNTRDNPKPLTEQLSLFEKIIGAAATGLVLGLSGTGFGVWWLAWCAVAPLLILIRGSKSWKEAIVVGLVFGLAYNLLTLSWLFSFYPSTALPHIAIVLISTVTGLAGATVRALSFAGFSLLLYALPMRAGIFPDYRRPFFPYILTVPIAWIFFEHPSSLATAMHLNDLCYSQSGQLQLIQIVRLGGGKLLTFLIILSNTVLSQLVLALGNLTKPLGTRTDRLLPLTGSLVDLMTVVLLVVLCMLVGQGSEHSCANNKVPSVPASICSTKDVETINIQGCVIAAESTAALHGPTVITGQIFSAPSQQLYMSARKPYLSALFALPSSVLRFAYPPAGKILSDYVSTLPYVSSQVVNTQWGKIGISTGLSLASPSLVKEQVLQGVGLLVCLIPNWNCFHSTILDRQILASAVLRAVENGRYLVLSANNRVSAIIDPCGKVTVNKNQVQFLYRDTYFHNVDFD